MQRSGIDTIKYHTNKAPGLDGIVNEQIKASIPYMVPIFVKLFNIIFDSGIMPDTWTIENIKSIYKNKGDPKKQKIIDR